MKTMKAVGVRELHAPAGNDSDTHLLRERTVVCVIDGVTTLLPDGPGKHGWLTGPLYNSATLGNVASEPFGLHVLGRQLGERYLHAFSRSTPCTLSACHECSHERRAPAP